MEDRKMEMLKSRLQVASAMMSTCNYLSTKWIIDNILGGKEKNRMAKISNILNGR